MKEDLVSFLRQMNSAEMSTGCRQTRACSVCRLRSAVVVGCAVGGQLAKWAAVAAVLHRLMCTSCRVAALDVGHKVCRKLATLLEAAHVQDGHAAGQQCGGKGRCNACALEQRTCGPWPSGRSRERSSMRHTYLQREGEGDRSA